MIEIQFQIQANGSLELGWKAAEGEKSWICSSAHAVLQSFLRMSHQLNHWRGECQIPVKTEGALLEWLFVDLFEERLSYQILDHGQGPISKGRFTRLEYGRFELEDFQEAIYAAVTDVMVRLGLEGYRESLGQAFPLKDYERLAEFLKRSKHLPEQGEDLTAAEEPDVDEDEVEVSEDEDVIIEGHEVVWETEDGEFLDDYDDDFDDEASEGDLQMGPSSFSEMMGRKLVRHPEFEKLSFLIDPDAEDNSDEEDEKEG